MFGYLFVELGYYGQHIIRQVFRCLGDEVVGDTIKRCCNAARHAGDSVAVATLRHRQTYCRLIIRAVQKGNYRFGA